ncbi:MAG: hypothetical protein V7727_19820 [Sneathiella sp.]
MTIYPSLINRIGIGKLIGLIIGFFATLFGGEGKAIVPDASSDGGF